MSQISIKSPSTNKSIELTFDREIHFGPYLFNAKMVGFNILETLDTITDSICWSNNDQYVAVVEIVYDSINDKNISNLKTINTKTGNVGLVVSKEGILVPKSISNSGIVRF